MGACFEPFPHDTSLVHCLSPNILRPRRLWQQLQRQPCPRPPWHSLQNASTRCGTDGIVVDCSGASSGVAHCARFDMAPSAAPTALFSNGGYSLRRCRWQLRALGGSSVAWRRVRAHRVRCDTWVPPVVRGPSQRTRVLRAPPPEFGTSLVSLTDLKPYHCAWLSPWFVTSHLWFHHCAFTLKIPHLHNLPQRFSI